MSAGKKRKRYIVGEYIEFERRSQTTKGPFAAEIGVVGWLLIIHDKKKDLRLKSLVFLVIYLAPGFTGGFFVFLISLRELRVLRG